MVIRQSSRAGKLVGLGNWSGWDAAGMNVNDRCLDFASQAPEGMSRLVFCFGRGLGHCFSVFCCIDQVNWGRSAGQAVYGVVRRRVIPDLSDLSWICRRELTRSY